MHLLVVLSDLLNAIEELMLSCIVCIAALIVSAVTLPQCICDSCIGLYHANVHYCISCISCIGLYQLYHKMRMTLLYQYCIALRQPSECAMSLNWL